MKLVNIIPLTELYDDSGVVSQVRVRYLNSAQIKILLRSAKLKFVIADVGHIPKWMSAKEVFQFWREEGKTHIGGPHALNYADYPGEYAYLASEWRGKADEHIILFEKYH